jgi:hypothetical protein
MGLMTLFSELVLLSGTNAPPENLSRPGDRPSIPLLHVLERAGDDEGGYLLGVRRKLNVALRMELLSNKMRREWFQQHPLADCENTLNAMHLCLGGELYMDGILCYKKGVQLRETFGIYEIEGNGD